VSRYTIFSNSFWSNFVGLGIQTPVCIVYTQTPHLVRISWSMCLGIQTLCIPRPQRMLVCYFHLVCIIVTEFNWLHQFHYHEVLHFSLVGSCIILKTTMWSVRCYCSLLLHNRFKQVVGYIRSNLHVRSMYLFECSTSETLWGMLVYVWKRRFSQWLIIRKYLIIFGHNIMNFYLRVDKENM